MVKAMEAFRRRPDMTLDAFFAHWRFEHTAVVLGLPGLQRYVQNHPLAAVAPPARWPWDGVVETWWPSVDVMRENGRSSYWEEVVADEQRFIDRDSVGILLVDEEVRVETPVPPGAVKRFEFLRRDPTLEPAEFRVRWREQRAPVVAELPGLRRYVLSMPRAGAYREGRTPFCDGIESLWFDDAEALDAAEAVAETAAATSMLAPDARREQLVVAEYRVREAAVADR